jgi:internalin A
MSYNKLDSCPVALRHLTKLQRLSIGFNPIGDDQFPDDSFQAQMFSMTLLIIPGTNITKIPTAVTRLQNLTVMNIKHNPITVLVADDLRSTSMAASLEGLYMDHCQLTSVPDALNHLHQLTRLSLSDNRIVKIEPNAFHGLTHLTHLYLSGNPIKSISPRAFVQLRSLSTLYVRRTLLTTIPVAIQPLHQLSELYPPDSLVCACADKWLLTWMAERSRSIIYTSQCIKPTTEPGFFNTLHTLPPCH